MKWMRSTPTNPNQPRNSRTQLNHRHFSGQTKCPANTMANERADSLAAVLGNIDCDYSEQKRTSTTRNVKSCHHQTSTAGRSCGSTTDNCVAAHSHASCNMVLCGLFHPTRGPAQNSNPMACSGALGKDCPGQRIVEADGVDLPSGWMNWVAHVTTFSSKFQMRRSWWAAKKGTGKAKHVSSGGFMAQNHVAH